VNWILNNANTLACANKHTIRKHNSFLVNSSPKYFHHKWNILWGSSILRAYKPSPINVFVKRKMQTIVTATENPQINKHLQTKFSVDSNNMFWNSTSLSCVSAMGPNPWTLRNIDQSFWRAVTLNRKCTSCLIIINGVSLTSSFLQRHIKQSGVASVSVPDN